MAPLQQRIATGEMGCAYPDFFDLRLDATDSLCRKSRAFSGSRNFGSDSGQSADTAAFRRSAIPNEAHQAKTTGLFDHLVRD
jgi:hypothetical protein